MRGPNGMWEESPLRLLLWGQGGCWRQSYRTWRNRAATGVTSQRTAKCCCLILPSKPGQSPACSSQLSASTDRYNGALPAAQLPRDAGSILPATPLDGSEELDRRSMLAPCAQAAYKQPGLRASTLRIEAAARSLFICLFFQRPFPTLARCRVQEGFVQGHARHPVITSCVPMVMSLS